MKIAIDVGHNCPGDRGASGLKISEDRLILELADKLDLLLRQENVDVVMIRPQNTRTVNESLQQRVKLANNSNADFFVSLHFNAFYGVAHGAEVYYRSLKGGLVAQRIQSEICKLGFHDRKTKLGRFYVLKKTAMPAVLVECCFCDSQKDMQLYNASLMAVAIKNGLLDKKGVYPVSNKNRQIVIGNNTWIKGSVDQSSELIETKIELELSEVNKRFLPQGVYTATLIHPEEEAHFYVELKSGIKGYVYAEHLKINP